jgi:hypothetical protein
MIPSHLTNAYNRVAQNEASRDPGSAKLRDKLARLLFGASFDAIPDAAKQAIRLAINAGVANGLGELVGVSDGGSNFGQIFQGVISSARGVGYTNSSGGGGYRGGISPEAIAVSRQMKRVAESVAYGSGARGATYGVGTGSGVTPGNLTRLVADVVRQRGGFTSSEVTKYTSDGSFKDNVRMLQDMKKSGAVPLEEYERVSKGVQLSAIRDSLYRTAQGTTEAEKEADVKRKMKDLFSIKDEEKRKAAIRRHIGQARRRDWQAKVQEMKAQGASAAEIKEAKVAFDIESTEMMGSSDVSDMTSMSEADYELAKQMGSGRAEFTTVGRDVEDSIKKAVERGAVAVSELSKALGTDNFAELKQAAAEFGSTTLTSEADVRNIKNVLDNAYRRAAAQGRSVAEVIQETRDIAAHAAAVLGPQNVNGTVIGNIAAARDSTRGNRDMGLDMRTDEQVAAEVAAREAGMQTQMQDAIIALELASQGEGEDADKAREYIKMLQEVQAGKRTLSVAEREELANFGSGWMSRNTYQMSPEEKSKLMRESRFYETLSSAYQSSVLTDHTEGVGYTFANKAATDDRGLFKEVLNDKMYADIADPEERKKKITADIAATARFFGNDHAARKTFFDDFASQVTDDKSYETFKKQYLDRLKEEGYSEEGLKDAEKMLDAANRARQSGVLDRYGASDVGIVAQMQKQDQIRNLEGHTGRHKRREEAIAAYEEKAKKAAQNVQEEKKQLFGTGFGVGPEDMTAEAMLAGVLNQYNDDAYQQQTSKGAETATKAGYVYAMNGSEYLTEGINSMYKKQLQNGAGAFVSRNVLALQKGDKGGLSKAKLIEHITALQESLKSENPAERKAAQERLNMIAKMMGSDVANVQGMVSGMSDKDLEKHIMQRASESGGTLAVNMDSAGNVVMADTVGLSKAAEAAKREHQLKFLGEMDMLGANGQAAYNKRKRGENLTQQEQADLDAAFNEVKDSIKQSFLIQAAETLGLETSKDKNGNIIGSTADGKTYKLKDVENEEDKSGRYDMILEAAAQNEGLRKQIEEKAKAGDKTAQEILLRDTQIKSGGATEGRKATDHSTVNYKAWSDAQGKKITDEERDAIEDKQEELDKLEKKSRNGELSWKERERMQQLHKELQQATNGYGLSAAEREAAGYTENVNKDGVNWTNAQKENLARVREATGGEAGDTGDFTAQVDVGEKTVNLLTKMKDILASVFEGDYLRVKDQSITIMGNSW